MIRHIVLVRFPEQTAPADIEGIFARLQDLVATLPGMLNFHAGTDINSLPDLNQGYTHAFTIDFADTAARDAYFESAGHIAVAERLVPLLTGGVEDIAMFQIPFEAVTA